MNENADAFLTIGLVVLCTVYAIVFGAALGSIIWNLFCK